MTTSTRSGSFIKAVGITSFVLGLIFVLAGVGTWAMVSSQLADEEITVAEDARWFGGSQVRGPLTAFAQADIINTHALHATEGRTYAELGAAMQGVDPESEEHAELSAQRQTVMNASFLRASLFTSVVAFGVAALVIGLGTVLALTGVAIRRLATLTR
ncbi:aromatic ring-opening dioxygenase LigA [Ruania suaedae]|uniref:aromatic ring-opening dioxygenase LigA n=1 Tax=Ruania suaedae TaxID=2897774 RepID=UPI001E4CCF5C|nr:aromatic ring-opening dioxygenase LigA [Ruania suaedae]UFU02056.1 aromatic ring-opening dioxygenase LigA [Ruania suaedae]